MASFNISKGLEKNLPTTKIDGNLYFCTDTGNMYIDYQDGNTVSRKLVNKNTIDAKANKADIATTIYQGTATQNVTYWKVSGFGNWGTGAWYEKGFSMLLSSRAGEMIWVSLAANDSATSAEAIRLFNRYSKMASISYSTSESAIYITAAGWANNICAHILSNINGDYVPTISQASALPADATSIPITEMGPIGDQLNIGCSGSKKLNLTGSTDRPLYNSVDLALKSDVDTHTSNKSNPHGVTLAQLGVNATAAELNYVDGVTSAIQTQLNGKVSKSGDTMTGSLTIGEGRDLCLQATAGSADSGDIIFRNGSGVEIGRVWISDSTLSFRNSESAPISEILHAQNYATHLDGRYVNTAGDTMTGQLRIHRDNPYLELKDNAYDTIWYIQAYQDTIAFGPTYANAVKTDKNGNMTVPGTVRGSTFKCDSTEAAIKPSDSNEVNFGSNASYIYFGYENRIGSSGKIDTYKFGTHSGAGGATNGNIECGTVKIGSSKLVYDSTNECLNFTF